MYFILLAAELFFDGLFKSFKILRSDIRRCTSANSLAPDRIFRTADGERFSAIELNSCMESNATPNLAIIFPASVDRNYSQPQAEYSRVISCTA